MLNPNDEEEEKENLDAVGDRVGGARKENIDPEDPNDEEEEDPNPKENLDAVGGRVGARKENDPEDPKEVPNDEKLNRDEEASHIRRQGWSRSEGMKKSKKRQQASRVKQ